MATSSKGLGKGLIKVFWDKTFDMVGKEGLAKIVSAAFIAQDESSRAYVADDLFTVKEAAVGACAKNSGNAFLMATHRTGCSCKVRGKLHVPRLSSLIRPAAKK